MKNGIKSIAIGLLTLSVILSSGAGMTALAETGADTETKVTESAADTSAEVSEDAAREDKTDSADESAVKPAETESVKTESATANSDLTEEKVSSTETKPAETAAVKEDTALTDSTTSSDAANDGNAESLDNTASLNEGLSTESVLEKGTYKATIECSSGMFIAKNTKLDGTLTVAADGAMTCTFTTKTSKYNRLYLSAARPASDSDTQIITGVQTEDKTGYIFTNVKVPANGTAFDISLGKAGLSDWLAGKTLTVTAGDKTTDSGSAGSGSSTDQSGAGSSGASGSGADSGNTGSGTTGGASTLEVGQYKATVASSYSMLIAKNTTLDGTLTVAADGTTTCTFTTLKKNYSRIFVGDTEPASADQSGVVIGTPTEDQSGFTFKDVPVPAAGTPFTIWVYGGKTPHWYDGNAVTLTVTKGEKIITAGNYNATISSSYAMLIASGTTLDGTLTIASDGTMTSTFTTLKKNYSRIFVGDTMPTSDDPTGVVIGTPTEDKSGFTFKDVPVPATGTPFTIWVYGGKTPHWYFNATSTVKLTVASGSKIENPSTPVVPVTPSQPDSGTVTDPATLADGTYSVTVTTDKGMFQPYNAICGLTVKDHKATLQLTLSGTGYNGIAFDASHSQIFEPTGTTTDSKGNHSEFDIPISALNQAITVWTRGTRSGSWASHTITIAYTGASTGGNTDHSDTNQKGGVSDTGSESASNEGVTSQEAIDAIIANTQSGTVADGVYTPSFGYTGGSGRATISCPKVVVSGGSATATIVFSSGTFTTLTVGGTTYSNTNPGGNSTFVIPVNLNGATGISVLTTAMSAPHWVYYVLYIYVDGTDATSSSVQKAALAESGISDAASSEDGDASSEDSFENALALKNAMDAEGGVSQKSAAIGAEDTAAAKTQGHTLPVILAILAAACVIFIVFYKRYLTKKRGEGHE